MHDRVRIYIAACFYYSGLVKLIRWWSTQRSRPHLIILSYHQAAGGDLHSHLLYLQRHYRILHLETALEELYMPHKKGVQRKDRRTLLALTFDDGYYDNYTDAFPLACELQIPIIIFLIPDLARPAAWQPAQFWQRDESVDAQSGSAGLFRTGTDPKTGQWPNHSPEPQTFGHQLETGQTPHQQSRPQVSPKQTHSTTIVDTFISRSAL